MRPRQIYSISDEDILNIKKHPVMFEWHDTHFCEAIKKCNTYFEEKKIGYDNNHSLMLLFEKLTEDDSTVFPTTFVFQQENSFRMPMELLLQIQTYITDEKYSNFLPAEILLRILSFPASYFKNFRDEKGLTPTNLLGCVLKDNEKKIPIYAKIQRNERVIDEAFGKNLFDLLVTNHSLPILKTIDLFCELTQNFGKDIWPGVLNNYKLLLTLEQKELSSICQKLQKECDHLPSNKDTDELKQILKTLMSHLQFELKGKDALVTKKINFAKIARESDSWLWAQPSPEDLEKIKVEKDKESTQPSVRLSKRS